MKQRVITGVLFTIGIALFIAPGLKWLWVPLILLLFVCLVAVQELLNAVQTGGLKTPRIPVFVGSLTFLAPLILTGLGSTTIMKQDTSSTVAGLALSLFALISIMILNLIVPLLKTGPEGLLATAAGSLIMAYVAFPLVCSVLLLYTVKLGWFWLVLALLTPWASDVSAYFTGSAIGRHRFLPHISPKKTIEGCIGGVVGTVIVLMLYFELVLARMNESRPEAWRNLIFAAVAGIILSLASQLGDWLASAIKRRVGIKDFGRLLPGHGGILDRFDSAFFTMPATLVLALLYWSLF